MIVPTLLALMMPSALAFAPTDDTWIGVEPNRVWNVHPAVQNRLRRDADWQAFLASDGAGWFARFDERTGTAHRAYGPGIPLPDTDDASSVERSLRGLLKAHEGLLGVPLSELALKSANYVASNDTWYVDFDRIVPDGQGGGVPIWRGGVTARVRGGELVMFGIDTTPTVAILPPPQRSEASAVDAALLGGPAPMGQHEDVWARLVALPDDGAEDLRLVYEVHSRTAAPLGQWVTLVDATTGKVVTAWNEIRFFSGTITGTHDTRTVDGDTSTSALPLVRFSGSDGSTVYAGEDGSFELSDEVSWTATLVGTWLTVDNRGRDGEGSLSVSTGTPNWTTEDASQAEIDSYKFLHDVRAWGLAVAPDIDISNDRLTSNVNISSSCNAYYDGNVNFYAAGGGCNNTGQIADVNYHEWGHGFHYTGIQSGSFDGSISEGIGDVVSNILTADSIIGPYFYTSGGGIRDTSTDYVYPDDVTGEVHQDGLIFAGAIWDLWEELATSYGETREDRGEAWFVTSSILAGIIRGGPTIPDSYDEALLADDDDNDVTNGTPHLCEIVEAFGRHGLGPGGTETLLAIDHLPVGNQAAGVDVPMVGAMLNLAPECNEFTLASALVNYSTDGGATWSSAPLAVSGEGFDGVIPGLPDGTVVHYYLSGQSAEGGEVFLPADAEVAPYSFYVGGLVPLYCNNFDDDDGGFTHELLDGNDREGADDWQNGRPRGEGGDPEAAASGTRVWGNDLGEDNYNGQYQSSIHNRLTTPPIDVGGYTTVVVQFNRWLGVEDGRYDQARFLVNETEAWLNHESGDGEKHTEDGEWKLHTSRVDGVAGTVTLAWEIESDQGLEYGGWTIDDLCVYGTVDTNALLEITDFAASDDQIGAVELSWTQPTDSSAVYATVVRRADRFAQTRDDVGDGQVVYDAEVTPGAPVSYVDAVEGTWYYTVFAGSDSAWLTGADDPGNADDGTGLGEGGENGGDNGGDNGGTDNGGTDGGENPEDGDTIKINAGCGCATGSPADGALGLLAGLAGLALVRRRR